MEDFNGTEEDQSNLISQKDSEQRVKELTTPTPFNCETLHSSFIPSCPPYPALGGATVLPSGENNAKQTTKANGQVPSVVSSWPVVHEVPPRFRNQQEPKILLKRGQSLDGISPFSCTGDQLNITTQRSASLTYANSTCGPGALLPQSQGMDKIVVDGSDLQTWPSIIESRKQYEFTSKDSWECNQGMRQDKMEQLELCVSSDGNTSKLLPPSCCETTSSSSNKESIQQEIQCQDGVTRQENSVEKLVGPKQAEIESTDDCNTLNEALTPDACQNQVSGELRETRGVWGTSRDDQVGWKVSGHDCDSNEAYQTVCGLTEMTDTVGRDVPEEGMSVNIEDRSPDCSQITATNTTLPHNKTSMTERPQEDLHYESTGHGSSEDGTWSHSNPRVQSSCTEETLQSMLSRHDLDPKVLCNTGWGQTQIKQSTAWDLEVDSNCESGQEWTKTAQVDRTSPSCPEWSMELQGTLHYGAGHIDELNEEKIVSEQGIVPTGKGNRWVETVKDELVGRWDGIRRDGGQQGEGDGASWDLDDNQWNENKGIPGQGKRSWVDCENEGWRNQQHKGWGGNIHLQRVPNNQTAMKGSNLQQCQFQNPQSRCSQESRDISAGPVAPNQSTGWKPSPIPHTTSSSEPSGWEDPSPQSISRKMEIDDGTSAWGDPTHYDNRSVNMWDKSNLQQRGQPCQQQLESIPVNTLKSRDKNTAWEQSAGSSEPVIDNTAGWGNVFDVPSNWRDPEESRKGTEWGGSRSNLKKTGSKALQDGWGDEGLNSSRHSNWEEEESSSGMWGNRSQDSTSSFLSGGWNQGHCGRRTGAKIPLKGNGGGSWMSPITRQLSNLGITDEDATSNRSRRGMNDFNGEMRRGGRGGVSFRSHGAKEQGTTGVFNTSSVAHLRGMQQSGVHHVNPSPGVRAQVPQQFLPPQVSGSVLNPMFPPHLSPQHLAMLSGIHPHMQQVQMAYQLLLQQQQQQHFLSHRKFLPHPHPLLQQQDPQQLARIVAVLQQRPKNPMSFPGYVQGAEPESVISGVKEVGGAQPQFKWLMDAGHPLCPSPPDPIILKNGLMPGPMKLRGDSSYPHFDLVGVDNMGVASPNLTDNWHRTLGSKFDSVPNTPTLPPEFQPGVPWKGVQSPEPDSHPYGGILGENTLPDTEHHLLQDNTEMNTILPSPGAWPYCASDTHNSVKFPALITSWPAEPIMHRTNRNISQLPRPPPGLTHQKQSPLFGVGSHMPRGWHSERMSQESPFGTENSWSGGSSTGSSWLLLSNLTPQIDSTTLKTICLQHGPLMTFNLSLAQGSALIRYCSPDEAAKAQSALHMCVLGNTTILAEFVNEEDVARYFAHSQTGETDRDGETERETGGGGEVRPSWENLDRAGLSLLNWWSHSREGGVWGGVRPGYHGNSLWCSPQVEERGLSLLPGDLLGGGTDTL